MLIGDHDSVSTENLQKVKRFLKYMLVAIAGTGDLSENIKNFLNGGHLKIKYRFLQFFSKTVGFRVTTFVKINISM